MNFNHVVKTEAKNVRKILEAFVAISSDREYEKSLMGACAVSAREISKRLESKRIKSKVLIGETRTGSSHAWVETKTHLIDVTYTQFNRNSPKVVFISKKGKLYKKYLKRWVHIEEAKSFKDWFGVENPSYWRKILKKVEDTNKHFKGLKL